MTGARRVGDGLARLSEWLALAVFALAPLPFGSVEPIFIASWIGLLSVSLMTASTRDVKREHLIVLALLFVVLLAYMASTTPWYASFTGEAPDPAWSEAAELLGENFTASARAWARPVLNALLAPLLFALAMARAVLIGARPGGAAAIGWTVAVAAVFYALVSAAQLIFDPQALLWREKTAYLSNLTGPFTNRNTAAVYFGTATVIWALALQREARLLLPKNASLGDAAQLLLTVSRPKLAALAFCMFICFGATAATSSRAGFLLTGMALTLASLLYLSTSTAARRLGWVGCGAALLAGLALMEIWGGGVASRIAQRGLADAGRATVYARVAEAIAERPLAGRGVGSFLYVFPSMRPEPLGSMGIWDRAHSTPLEIAFELGLPTALLVVGAYGAMVIRLAVAAVRRRRSDVIIGFCAALIGGLHACIDFSLQIPGYAVVCAALAGAGLASASKRRRDTYAGRASGSGRRDGDGLSSKSLSLG